MTASSTASSTPPGTPAATTERWMQAYLRAWNSNEPEEIRALFTEDAQYYPEPYSPPWVGQSAIVEGWLDHADALGDFTFEWAPLVLTPEVSIVQGTTRYTAGTAGGTVYSNLWVIRFAPDGRAREFTEWWMDQAHDSATDSSGTDSSAPD